MTITGPELKAIAMRHFGEVVAGTGFEWDAIAAELSSTEGELDTDRRQLVETALRMMSDYWTSYNRKGYVETVPPTVDDVLKEAEVKNTGQ